MPAGIADEFYLCELAERLHMTVQDLCQRASNYEVAVLWPAKDREDARLRAIGQAEHDRDEELRRSRL